MKKLKIGFVAVILACAIVMTPVLASPVGDASSIQAELNRVISRIDQLQADLVRVGEEIEQKSQDLEEAERMSESQYRDMVLRIRHMYEQNNNNILHRLVSAGSFSGFVAQVEYIQALHTHDRQLLTEFSETIEEINELVAALEEERTQLQGRQSEFDSERATLRAALNAHRIDVATLNQPAAEAGQSPAAQAPAGDASRGQAIVNAARSMIGTPYVWGGTTPGRGLDCSGLTMMAHRQVGISIPRTSSQQGAAGRCVGGLANALPGDVVHYPGHVAIYIGGGQVIHAPTFGQTVRVAGVHMGPGQPIRSIRRFW